MPSPRRARESRGAGPGSPAPLPGRFEWPSPPSDGVPGPEAAPGRLRPPESSPVHRRGSPAPPPPPPPPPDRMKLNPSFPVIALRSLLAVDLWLSKRLGVCAGDDSLWGSARPLLKLLEISGHGIPWLAGTVYCLSRSASWAGREVLLNLLFALLLDLLLVALLKALVRRRRPAHNRMDMFVTLSVDRYSFPSGHATRAALVCRFVLHHLAPALPLRVLVVLWAFVLGLSRVMLGRHNVTDVAFGFFFGYVQYNVVDYCWLSPLNAPALFSLWTS